MKHIVGFSGGIDSQAAARLVLDKYGPADVILLNSVAGGNEDPLTYEFIREYSQQVHPVISLSAINADMWEDGSSKPAEYGLDPNGELDFPGLIARKGVPTGKRRTCTYILKLKPQLRWMRQEFGPGGRHEGQDYERYTGLRRDESESRKSTPDREWDAFFDCWLNHIIAGWTKQQCFDFVLSRGEPINPLYSLGFNRVGCAPCVESTKADIRNWAIRRPEMIDKIAAWEESVTLPARDSPGFNWFTPLTPTKRHNNIREVVEWAMTDRGGRQNMFPVFHEREACESKYGLCE